MRSAPNTEPGHLLRRRLRVGARRQFLSDASREPRARASDQAGHLATKIGKLLENSRRALAPSSRDGDPRRRLPKPPPRSMVIAEASGRRFRKTPGEHWHHHRAVMRWTAPCGADMHFSNQIGRPKPPGQAIRARGRLRYARQHGVLEPHLPPSNRLPVWLPGSLCYRRFCGCDSVKARRRLCGLCLPAIVVFGFSLTSLPTGKDGRKKMRERAAYSIFITLVASPLLLISCGNS